MGNDTRITFRATPRQHFELGNIATELNISRSSIMRYIANQFIEDYEQKREEKQTTATER